MTDSTMTERFFCEVLTRTLAGPCHVSRRIARDALALRMRGLRALAVRRVNAILVREDQARWTAKVERIRVEASQ